MDEPTGFYPVRLIEERRPDGTSTWFAEHPQLPQCHAVGETQEAALENLERTRHAWLSWAESHNFPVPGPRDGPAISVFYAISRDVPQAKQADEDVGSTETFEVRGAAA